MCQILITTTVAGKCRHKIEELPKLEPCEEAMARGGTAYEVVKNIYLGHKTTKEFCPDCLAAREQGT